MRLKYIDIDSVSLLGKNPKRHDLENLIVSLERYGFRDAPILDKTLNAIAAGNGRITALREMRVRNMKPPLGIIEKDGKWLAPFQVGQNSKSTAEGISFAIDHNNLTVLGGSFTPAEIARIWTPDYIELLVELLSRHGELVSVTGDDLDILLNYSGLIPDGMGAEKIPDEMERVKVVITGMGNLPEVARILRQLCDAHPEWEAKII
jgi:hypothetical protein